MLTGNPASDEVQVPCQLPLQAARRLTVVGTLAGTGPGAVANEFNGPHEHLLCPHQMLPTEPELAGALCSAHRDPETDQGIGTICGYPEGVGLMALDVLSCELDGRPPAGRSWMPAERSKTPAAAAGRPRAVPPGRADTRAGTERRRSGG
jgi:hypothetical protein